MYYKKLAELYESLSSTTKRLEKTDILAKFLVDLKDSDKEVLYLILGDIYPEYDQRKIGISNQLAIKAIAKSVGTENSSVVLEWKKLGDLGLVAEELKKKKKQVLLSSSILTTEKVLANMRKLPELEGKGTVEKKLSLIIEENGKIIGVLKGKILSKSTLKVSTLFIAIRYQKKGFGSKLLKKVENNARKIGIQKIILKANSLFRRRRQILMRGRICDFLFL